MGGSQVRFPREAHPWAHQEPRLHTQGQLGSAQQCIPSPLPPPHGHNTALGTDAHTKPWQRTHSPRETPHRGSAGSCRDWLPLPTPPARPHQAQSLPPLGCNVCGAASRFPLGATTPHRAGGGGTSLHRPRKSFPLTLSSPVPTPAPSTSQTGLFLLKPSGSLLSLILHLGCPPQTLKPHPSFRLSSTTSRKCLGLPSSTLPVYPHNLPEPDLASCPLSSCSSGLPQPRQDTCATQSH